MTQYEMAENISEKCGVTMEEARNALEAGEWNMLTAAQQIEVDKVRRMQELDEVATSCAAAVQFESDADQAATAVQFESDAGQAAAVQFEADAGQTDETVAAKERATAERAEAKERAGKRRRARSLGNAGHHLRRLLAWGNRNRLTVRRDGAVVMELPVTVLAPLMLCAFWVCVPLLVLGLFAGFQYSFTLLPC